MTHMDGKGMNILEENIKRLKELFPEIVTEGKVDFDTLRQVLGDYVEEDKEAYSFTWSGKGAALRHSQTPPTGTLRPAKEESKDWDTTRNLYLEGDNLEVLNILQRAFFGRIKLIYIDPPYNTGNDFVYKDDYRNSIQKYKEMTNQLDTSGRSTTTNPETSGRYHRDWLNMMYPRLRLARNLLTEDGSIFISIDDNEVHNLQKVCSEVFGEENYVGCITRATGTTTGQDAAKIGSSLDYLLVFRKTDEFSLGGIALSEDDENRFRFEDEKGKYSVLQLRKTGNADRREDRPNMYYPVESPDGKEVYPIGPGGYESRWRFGRDTYQQYCDENLVVWLPSRSGEILPYVKYYLDGRIKQVSNLWTDIDGNKKGSLELKELLGKKVFDNPKPIDMLLRILEVSGVRDSDVILDFFSGSASTAHAVLKKNAEDNVKLRYIMVQFPEITSGSSEARIAGYTTISAIGKDRICRAGESVKKQAIEAWNAADMEQRQQIMNPDELDIGFKVFKLDSTNLIKWNPDRENLEASLLGYVDNLEPGRSEDDLLYEVMLKMGADLTWPVEVHKAGNQIIYSIGFGALMVCLSDRITTEVADAMVRLKEEMKPETWKVVFKDSGFADDMAKTNIKETLKCAGLPEDAFTTL